VAAIRDQPRSDDSVLCLVEILPPRGRVQRPANRSSRRHPPAQFSGRHPSRSWRRHGPHENPRRRRCGACPL
jgi:hypothetical protein